MSVKTISLGLSALFTAWSYSPTVTCFMGLSGDGQVKFEAENTRDVFNSVAREFGSCELLIFPTTEKFTPDSELTEGMQLQVMKLTTPDFIVRDGEVYLGSNPDRRIISHFFHHKKFRLEDGDCDEDHLFSLLKDRGDDFFLTLGNQLYFSVTEELVVYLFKKPKMRKLVQALSAREEVRVLDSVLMDAGFKAHVRPRGYRGKFSSMVQNSHETKQGFLAGDEEIISKISPEAAVLLREFFADQAHHE